MPLKEEERCALGEFRKVSGELPGLVQGNRERPDFVVVSPTGLSLVF